MPPDPPKTPERRVDLNKFDEQDKTWLQKAKVNPSEEVAKPFLRAPVLLGDYIDKVLQSLPKNDDQTSYQAIVDYVLSHWTSFQH